MMDLEKIAKNPSKWHRLSAQQLGKVKAIAAAQGKKPVKAAPKAEPIIAPATAEEIKVVEAEAPSVEPAAEAAAENDAPRPRRRRRQATE